MDNIALGNVNEAGLKSILEDSHFSREFDQGVDLHNMKEDYGINHKELNADLNPIINTVPTPTQFAAQLPQVQDKHPLSTIGNDKPPSQR